MKIRYLLIISMFLVFLVACSNDDGNDDIEEVTFEPKTFIVGEDRSKLEEMKSSQEEVFSEYIKSMDYVISNIMIVDSENDYYYTDILNKKTEEVLRLQLLYMDVHRNYMKKLYTDGASIERLMTQNRLFKKYLDIYKGQKFVDKREEKTVIEDNFLKYNIEEFDAVVKGIDLVDFINNYDKWERDIGYDKWFNDNADFEGDLLSNYNIVLEKISADEESSIKDIINFIREAEDMINYNNYSGSDKEKDIEDSFESLNDWKSKIEENYLSEENNWIKERAFRIIDGYINYLVLLKEGEIFEASDELFFDNIEEMEDKVSLYLLNELLINGEIETVNETGNNNEGDSEDVNRNE